MEKLNIFVVSHKLVNESEFPGRKIIYVGKKHNCSPNNLTTFTDNTKNNIAKLNPYYCELTALYWVWKNYPKSEYIGFEHYSRNFNNIFKMSSLKSLYRKARRCDMIHLIRMRHIKSCKNFWFEHEGKYLYPILERAIKKAQPSYYDDWTKIMNGHYLSYCNMFICKWDTFDSLMNFMFSVLNKAYEEVKKQPREIQSRSIGYMSERLLDAFVLHNKLKCKSHLIRTKKH